MYEAEVSMNTAASAANRVLFNKTRASAKTNIAEMPENRAKRSFIEVMTLIPRKKAKLFVNGMTKKGNNG